ncbi:MAG: discoidin domain-containing protein, partial [Phycisphaeraceae bacterium]|nr:discoidin domain-containing protein [Phycisphaeraceae bacterium]
MCKKMTTLILALGMSLMILSANAGTISYVLITNDVDCGISPDNTYTHTLDFGTGSPGASINGVQFDAYNNAALGTLNFNREVASGSLSDHAGNGGHNVSGDLVDLMTDMYYNGNNAVDGVTTWTLSGLTAGKTYHARIYTRQWGAGNDRTAAFVFDPDGAGPISDASEPINQDDATSAGLSNDNDAYYINYQFKAVSGQDLVITLTQSLVNQSWHLYGISNQLFSSETASALQPINEATDVLRDTDLAWEPGDYAVTHNVYVGDSFDAVDTATVPTASDLTVTSYDPGRMDFGKTTFWRVDEVNGAPDKTVFRGDVWSFEVEPYSIQIPGSTIAVTASSVSNEFSTAEKTIDGSGLGADNTHDMSAENMWFTGAVDLDPWIQYEFDDVIKLDIMTVWNSNGAAESAIGWGVKDVQIEYSVDGENWDVLEGATQLGRAPGLPTYNQPDEIAFNGVAAKVVRLNIASNWGGILMSYGLSEVQFNMIPAAARTPEPVSGSVDVLPTATIQWRAGREADQHTIYASMDQDAVADGTAPSVTSSTHSLDLASLDLELGQTYYWR